MKMHAYYKISGDSKETLAFPKWECAHSFVEELAHQFDTLTVVAGDRDAKSIDRVREQLAGHEFKSELTQTETEAALHLSALDLALVLKLHWKHADGDDGGF